MPMASGPDRYLVVGNPIAHSRSPEIHAAFAAQTGQHILYERRLIETDPPEAFAAAMRHFFQDEGGRGANVTLPFKEAAFRIYMDSTWCPFDCSYSSIKFEWREQPVTIQGKY